MLHYFIKGIIDELIELSIFNEQLPRFCHQWLIGNFWEHKWI